MQTGLVRDGPQGFSGYSCAFTSRKVNDPRKGGARRNSARLPQLTSSYQEQNHIAKFAVTVVRHGWLQGIERMGFPLWQSGRCNCRSKPKSIMSSVVG